MSNLRHGCILRFDPMVDVYNTKVSSAIDADWLDMYIKNQVEKPRSYNQDSNPKLKAYMDGYNQALTDLKARITRDYNETRVLRG